MNSSKRGEPVCDLKFFDHAGRQTALCSAVTVFQNPAMAVSAENAEEILTLARDWIAQGRRVALATVIETWGSAPRQTGSLLVCDDGGNFGGSVSGGCVQVSVIQAARATIRDGKPQLLEFGVSDADAWSVGLACGGRIRVFIERVE
jgi:hypothetical protein